MSFMREPDAEPIPGYRLIEPLGSGGFGEVWKCEAPGGLFKAIKFVYGNLNSMDAEGVRAEQELQALQKIKEVRHPFVLSLDRIENVRGELIIIMELADKSLHDCFVECQAAGLIGVPRDALLRYIRDAAEALDHMIEKHNLLHLDIKPRNLFVVSDRVKVADFGLVKQLEREGTSSILGGVTPLYAPPETFSNKITPFSDQYSLAIVYQELLTGQRPFAGKNARMLAMQHMKEDPELRSLPEAERPIVGRALSKDPSKRYPTCMAFVRALYNARGTRTTVAEVGAKAEAGALDDMFLDQLGESTSGAPGAIVAGAPPEGEESQLGITVAQPQTGTLRPTLLIGLGSFGRRVLLELRCRFLDRFGDPRKVPMVRFLYVDSDLEAVQAVVRGTPGVALSTNEVCHLPLQPTGNYRRRMLEQLLEWLPREKLYSVPRNLQTQGSRALGRLAFADNYLRLLARLRRELQDASHPDSLYQSVSQTGLALRDSVPRVYVIAAAGGGASGQMVDLGFALRRLLTQMRHDEAELIGFLFAGAPNDPATPRVEQANIWASITELYHYGDPAVPFTAQYGADGNRLAEQGKPFGSVYVTQLPNRDPEALRDAVAHMGSYLFHDLTTPLGLRLDRCRQAVGSGEATAFRSFGTYTVWFPRGLLLRQAARQACAELLGEWQATGATSAPAEVEATCNLILSDQGLGLASLCEEIIRKAGSGWRVESGGSGVSLHPSSATHHPPPPASLQDALDLWLAQMDEQSRSSMAHDDPGKWARQAVAQAWEWLGAGDGEEVGSGDSGGSWSGTAGTEDSPRGVGGASSRIDLGHARGRLVRSLSQAAQQVAEQWDQRLADAAFGLMQYPGRRVAAAEAALARFMQFCQEAAGAHRAGVDQQAQRTHKVREQLEAAVRACVTGQGGFSFFGSRAGRLLKSFMDALVAYARQRLAEEILRAGLYFFAQLRGKLDERVRELAFCRQRLRPLQEALETGQEFSNADGGSRLADSPHPQTASRNPQAEPSTEAFWESIRQSRTVQVVLPDGEQHLENAAALFLKSLTTEQWAQLDMVLQERALASMGSLYRVCSTTSDLGRYLAGPLMDHAATFLGELLPVTDVAQVEFSIADSGSRMADPTDPQAANRKPQAETVEAQIRSCHARALPPVTGRAKGSVSDYLLVPSTDAGKLFGEAAEKAIEGIEVLRVPNQADLMFCREQGFLSSEDLANLIRSCQAAYEEMSRVPNISPHSRFDVGDWLPLVP